MQTTEKRKGARRMADIPPAIRQAINLGQIETVNLVEFLAADLSQLLPAVAAQIGLDRQHPELLTCLETLPSLKPMQRHPAAAHALWLAGCSDNEAHNRLASHCSDLARQWAALQIPLHTDLTLAERLTRIRRFAADHHFGVREFAWMAVRPQVAAEIAQALALLSAWSREEDANLRRFASEVSRPRGVWCLHIEVLKAEPALGLPLLTPLRNDPSRYVQDSVANWLNDAAKSQPLWVRHVCQAWQAEQPANKATARICSRAQRSMTLKP